MTAESTKAPLEDDAAGGMSSFLRLRPSLSATAGWVALICVLAFLLRYFYIVSLDHLLCQFGDAYFFLAGGSKLREFVCNAIQAGNFNLLDSLPPASPNGMVALGSLRVSDRLMVDGPIFPSYLAIVQWLVGLAPGSLLFDTKAIQISLVNALLDSFACLFIFLGTRAAFGRRAAYIAAALFAVYPASIINTQSCYTEPFGCFILAVWSWLLLKAFALPLPASDAPPVAKKPGLALSLSIGIATGLLALTRPPFVFLPVGFAVLLSVLRLWLRPAGARFAPKAFWSVLPFLAGLLIVLLPWLGITHKATGHYSLSVNRVPAFNLYLGNQLARDGWRAYPFPENIPETVSVAAGQILEQARTAPLAFASMELRKIPRLWVGVWNEFQYALFGIGVGAQEVFHQVLLSTAVIGLLLLITKRQCLREHDAALSLVVSVLVVQSLYLAFEPISRYTMTAVPVIVMLVGYAVNLLSAKPKHYLIVTLAVVIALVVAMHGQQRLIAFLATFVGDAAISAFAPGFYILLLTFGCFAFQKILKRAGLGSKPLSLVLVCAFALVSVLVVVSIKGNPEMAEWKSTLSSPEQMIRQEIVVPANEQVTSTDHAYLLLDMAQGQCPAPISVTVNNSPSFNVTPTPWWQILPNQGFLEALALSERAMATSLYSYRQWYALPLPASVIKYGAANTVTIAPAGTEPLTVYGDYAYPGQTQSCLPSLRLASWTKDFCTYDHQDGRVYEAVSTSQVHSTCFSHIGQNQKTWDDNDLSSDAGKQFGQYRIHFVVFSGGTKGNESAVAATTGDRKLMMSMPSARTISGADPSAMTLGESAVDLSALPVNPAQALGPNLAQDFEFKCQLSSPGDRGWAFIGVQFQGQEATGAVRKWTSRWQPYAIRTSKDWTPFYLSDALPDDILRLHNLRVSVTVCPFHSDQLLLHQKQAIKGKVSVKDLTLTLGTCRSESPAQSIRLY
jgi:hypothetical protein